MKAEQIVTALKGLKVQTGSLVCMGCGQEHNCGIHGCAIVLAAIQELEQHAGALTVIIENGKQLSAIRALVESLSAREAAREYRERTRNLNEIR